jgi:hypothetical protein
MSYKVDFETLRIGDIVRTPLGVLAIIARRSGAPEAPHSLLALSYPDDSRGEKNSWWSKSDGLQLVCRWGGVKAFCGIRAGKRKAKP